MIASPTRDRTFFSRLGAVAAAALFIGAWPASAGASPEPLHPAAWMRPAIVGGTTAPAGALPWVVYVQAALSGGWFQSCTGTVVAPRLVITAGHCADQPASTYRVISGRQNLDDTSGGQVSGVVKLITAPGYTGPPFYSDDAALLELSTPTTAPAIKLASPAGGGLLTPGTPAVIAGWGDRYAGDPNPPAALQQASTVLQDPSYCSSIYGASFNAASEVCALDAPSFNTSTCQGDSGGPSLAQAADGAWVEVGVTSRAPTGCATSQPDIFTRVDVISGWIGQVIASMPGPPAPARPATPAQTLPLAGIYHSRMVTLRVASNRRTVTVGFRCGASLVSHSLAVNQLRFGGAFRGHGRYRVRGVFTARGTARGSLTVLSGSCRRGTYRWRAAR